MWFSNPAKRRWDEKLIAEITALCRKTTLTAPEIAVFLDVPESLIVRTCAGVPGRTKGRPKRLSSEDVPVKVREVVTLYQDRGQAITEERLDRLMNYLMKRVTPGKEAAKPESPTKKRSVKRRRSVRRSEMREEFLLNLVVDYMVEVAKANYENKKFTMAQFAKARGLDYTSFTIIVKEYTERAEPLAQGRIREIILQYEERKYVPHVINYRAHKLLNEEEHLTRKSYCIENSLDYKIFNKYFGMYKEQVADDVTARFRELEELRLRALREEKVVNEVEGDIIPATEYALLEKLARKRLPVRNGRVIFSKSKIENSRLEDLWLMIADDVTHVGIIDAVARKWSQEINPPPSLSEEDQLRLISIRIETILKQLDIFIPHTGRLTFEQLNRWTTPKPPKEPEPKTEAPPENKEWSSVIAQPLELLDENWYQRELEKEEQEKQGKLEKEEQEKQEMRRYADTPEERKYRSDNNWIISNDDSSNLSKNQIDDMKRLGAIYDRGVWLLPTQEDTDQFKRLITENTIPEANQRTEIWEHSRKPRLLVGVGETDYTKEWMHKVFDLKTVSAPEAVASQVASFQPDALMLYKSSTGKKMREAMTDVSAAEELPLIVFIRGFPDAVLSAQAQRVHWFVNAYQQRKGIKRRRRYNPGFLNSSIPSRRRYLRRYY